MSDDVEGWEAVAQAVRDRLSELGMTISALQRSSRISDTTIGKLIRTGQPITRIDKRHALCKGLGWTPDSIDRILRGDPPMLLRDAATSEVDAVHLASLEAMVASLVSVVEELRDSIQALESGLRAPQ